MKRLLSIHLVRTLGLCGNLHGHCDRLCSGKGDNAEGHQLVSLWDMRRMSYCRNGARTWKRGPAAR